MPDEFAKIDAEELYMLMICIADGYLMPNSPAACRFFHIASALPMELQATLAYRTFGLSYESQVICDESYLNSLGSLQ